MRPGNLIPPKNLVVSVVGEGSVIVSPEGTSFQNLSEVTLTAVGTPDFAFSNWSGDASGNTNPLIITMDSDKNITANFVLALTGYELWRFTNFTTEAGLVGNSVMSLLDDGQGNLWIGTKNGLSKLAVHTPPPRCQTRAAPRRRPPPP